MRKLLKSDPRRVSAAVSFDKTDVSPVALSLAMQAGRTTGIPLPQLLRDPHQFTQAQLQMHERWQQDICIGMMYAAVEAEAFGAKIDFHPDGPPNVASMLVNNSCDLASLPDVDVNTNGALAASLETIKQMKQGLRQKALLCAVAVGPLSGPVMWMGMERWLEVLMTEPQFAADTIQKYQTFSLAWAEKQLGCGADILIWFEPLASTSLLPIELVRQYALSPLQQACQLGAPVVLHLASAEALNTAGLAVECGVTALSVGLSDNPQQLRAATNDKLTLLGAVNGIGMHHWDASQITAQTQQNLREFGQNGGFILCDAHGEIPYQVPPENIDIMLQTFRSS